MCHGDMSQMENKTDNSPPEGYISALYSLWSVQDTLLQYYRTMFLTAESLLIAIACSLIGNNARFSSWVLVTLGVLLWAVWLFVTWSRARDVRYTQLLIRRSEEGKFVKQPFSSFKSYQQDWIQIGKATISYTNGETEEFVRHGVLPTRAFAFKFLHPWHWGTRIHMEFVLPGTYLIAWVIVAIYAASA